MKKCKAMNIHKEKNQQVMKKWRPSYTKIRIKNAISNGNM
jgi:hypothetical protein